MRFAAFVIGRHEQLDNRPLEAHDLGVGLGLAQVAGGFVHEELDLFEQRLHFAELRLLAQDADGVAEVALLSGEFFGVFGVLLVGVLAAFEEVGLLADVVLGLRGADHRHDEFHQLGILLAGHALAFAGRLFLLQHLRPFLKLRAPLFRAAHGLQPEVRADETGEFVQLGDDLLLLHFLLHLFVFLVRHALDERGHVVGDAAHIFGREILAARDAVELRLFPLGDLFGLQSHGVLGQRLEPLGNLELRRRRRLQTVVEIAGVEVFVLRVQLFGGLAQRGQRLLLLLLRLGEFFAALTRLLRALGQRLGGFLHRRAGLLFDLLLELLPLGERALGHVLVAQRVLHHLGHFRGHLLERRLVRALAGLGLFDLLAAFRGRLVGLRFGERLGFLKLTLLVADALVELLEHFVHALADVLGVLRRAEHVDGVLPGLDRFPIREKIHRVGRQLDHAVHGDVLPRGRKLRRHREFLFRLPAGGARGLAFAEVVLFLAHRAHRPPEPRGLQPVVVARREVQLQHFVRQDRDALLDALQIHARLAVFHGADLHRVGLRGREAVLVRPAENRVADQLGGRPRGRDERLPLKVRDGVGVAMFHRRRLERAAGLAGEAHAAAFEKFRATALDRDLGRGVAEVAGHLDARGEFLHLRAVQRADADVARGVADAQRELAVLRLSRDAENHAPVLVEFRHGLGGV